MAKFGEIIRKHRIRKGLSMREVADAVGISSSYLSLIERDFLAPPVDAKLVALGKALGYRGDRIYIIAKRLPPDVRRFVALHTEATIDTLRELMR